MSSDSYSLSEPFRLTSLLIGGYIRQNILADNVSVNHLPSDIDDIITRYFNDNQYFLGLSEESDLFTVNSSHNISCCNYTRYQLRWDQFKYYGSMVLHGLFSTFKQLLLLITAHIIFFMLLCITSGFDINQCVTFVFNIINTPNDALSHFYDLHHVQIIILMVSICVSILLFIRICFINIKKTYQQLQLLWDKKNRIYVGVQLVNDPEAIYSFKLKILKYFGHPQIRIGLVSVKAYYWYDQFLFFTHFHSDTYKDTLYDGILPNWEKQRESFLCGVPLSIVYIPNKSLLKFALENEEIYTFEAVESEDENYYLLCIEMFFVNAGCVEYQLM